MHKARSGLRFITSRRPSPWIPTFWTPTSISEMFWRRRESSTGESLIFNYFAIQFDTPTDSSGENVDFMRRISRVGASENSLILINYCEGFLGRFYGTFGDFLTPKRSQSFLYLCSREVSRELMKLSCARFGRFFTAPQYFLISASDFLIQKECRSICRRCLCGQQMNGSTCTWEHECRGPCHSGVLDVN